MNNHMVLLYVFSVTTISMLVVLFFFRGLMSQTVNLGSFDPYGKCWILLYSVYWGMVISLLWLAIRALFSNESKFIGLLNFSIVCLFAYLALNGANQASTALDNFIGLIGYEYSQLFPYQPKDEAIPNGYVAAIPPKSRLEAVIDNEAFSIVAGQGLLRTIQWAGSKRSLELTPGALEPKVFGFYFPKSINDKENFPGDVWQKHHGITRCSYKEAIKRFRSTDEANAWIGKLKVLDWPIAYRNDGLLVMWTSKGWPKTLVIQVWQILVDGKKTMVLQGADDDHVKLVNEL